MGFKIKKWVAWLFHVLGISTLLLKFTGWKYKNKYIRVVNYHDTKPEHIEQFRKQLEWYKKHFSNVNKMQFEEFLRTGEIDSDKPGIMITFDDGYTGNYEVAYPVLEENHMTGYFLCSSDLVGTEGYMSYDNLRELIAHGHVIGDHTATHHRMNETDDDVVLTYEVAGSKKKIEEELEMPIDIFCWCGGEEEHYTKAAYDKITTAEYKYGFMTNSAPVVKGNNPYHIQRINVEDDWPNYLMKFQVCGFMDVKFAAKRRRVDRKLRQQ